MEDLTKKLHKPEKVFKGGLQSDYLAVLVRIHVLRNKHTFVRLGWSQHIFKPVMKFLVRDGGGEKMGPSARDDMDLNYYYYDVLF